MKIANLIVNIAMVALVIVLIITCLVLNKRIQDQKKQISEMEKKLENLGAIKNPEETTAENENTSDAYKYLAIGNSITVHGKCSYWWNPVGMAASSKDTDYFALVTKELEARYGNVEASAMSFAVWETQAHDRAQTYNTLDPHLSSDLDLVTIQLSENASDLTTFERDLEELIEHIREKCPDARIILVDDFWSDDKSKIKSRVAKNMDIQFANLGEIRGVKKYQSEMGAIVYGDDGSEHAVDHEGVAAHPGDKGMEYIAHAIIFVLK